VLKSRHKYLRPRLRRTVGRLHAPAQFSRQAGGALLGAFLNRFAIGLVFGVLVLESEPVDSRL
jgi:hypothetical protein